MIKTALTIAGSDSCGGAGIQADIKTFSALGIYGMSVITAITAQNSCGVNNIRDLDSEIIYDQIAAVYSDIKVDAVKIGMLANAETVQTVAKGLLDFKATNVVLDPVMISKHGNPLLKKEAVKALKQLLLPLSFVVTPNLPEAAEIVGFAVEDEAAMKKAAEAIVDMGPKYVVVKGGHLRGRACDYLYDGKEFIALTNERIDTIHTHGTGCTFSSAIAAGLAKGLDIITAVTQAKQYITTAITHGFPLGRGIGPTHHFYELYRLAEINTK